MSGESKGLATPAARLSAFPEALPGETSLLPQCLYPRGAVLCREGDPVVVLYVIDAGTVKLVRGDAGGRTCIVGLRSCGWLVGSTAAILHRSHAVTAITVTDCVLRPLLLEAFAPSAANPAFASWLNRMMAREVSEQMLTIARFAALSTRARLEHLLVQLMSPLGGAGSSNGHGFEVPLNREELAQLVGSTKEHVGRLLTRMVTQGTIVRDGTVVVVPTSSSLFRIASARRLPAV